MDFKYTTISLNKAYDMSFRHAIQVIEKNGGSVDGDEITIKLQDPKPVRLEVSFKDHHPIERRPLMGAKGGLILSDETSLEFEGVGFAITGGVQKTGEEDYTFNVEMYIDDELVETSKMPSDYKSRKPTPFWRYQLKKGKHTIKLKVLNPSDKAKISLNNLIVYDDKPTTPKY